MRFELPSTLKTRRDSFQLWAHIIELEIEIDWRVDAADIVHRDTGEQLLTPEHAAQINALYEQVEDWMTLDANTLHHFAYEMGPEVLAFIELDDIDGSFDRLSAERTKRHWQWRKRVRNFLPQ